MSILSKTTFAVAAAAALTAVPALSMPGGEHMMKKPKMSASQMKRLAACKAMDHAMAMKDRRCMKLMKAEEMHMQQGSAHDGEMSEHKM